MSSKRSWFPVGSLPWLLGYEIKLWWREFRSKPGSLVLLVMFGILGLLVLSTVGLSWIGLLYASQAEGILEFSLKFEDLPASVIWLILGVWLFWFVLSWAQAINLSISIVFERGDLDLLMASPLNSKVLVTSRLLSIMLQIMFAFGWPLFFILLFALYLPVLVGLIPSLLSLFLLASSLGLLSTLWLIRRLGSGQARIVGQILAGSMSALLVILSQILGRSDAGAWQRWPVVEALSGLFGEDRILHAQSRIWVPARAVFSDPLSVAVMVGLALGLSWLTVEVVHEAFVEGTQSAQMVKRAAQPKADITLFNSNLNRLLLFKEWKAIWRNPYLLSQIFLQFVFLGVFIVALSGGVQGNRSGTIAAFLVFITSNLAAALTQICVSAEEASDLLKTSPISDIRIRLFKLLAALIPVWILLIPLSILLHQQGGSGLIGGLIGLGATVCNALLSLWNTRPLRLEDLWKRGQRPEPGDLVLGILNSLSWVAWAALAYGVQTDAAWSGIPFLIVGVVMGLGYLRSRQLGQLLGF